MAQVIAGAAFVVGVDTGLLHLAAASACRWSAIFVGSEPALTGPVGRGPIAIARHARRARRRSPRCVRGRARRGAERRGSQRPCLARRHCSTKPRGRRRRTDSPADAGGARGLHVAVLVADQEAAGRVDRPVPASGRGSCRARACASPISCDRPRPARRGGTGNSERRRCARPARRVRRASRHRARDIVLGEQAARDAGLVRDDEDEIAGLVEPADRGGRARHPAKALARADIAVVVVDHAVAVEKGRRLGGSRCSVLCRHRISALRRVEQSRSTMPQIACAAVMWICWISAVSSAGATSR